SRFAAIKRHAWRENICEAGERRVQTYVSSAWAAASIPVAAVTARGCVTVNSGSRMLIRNAALRSPQAIFRCDDSSAIRASDWASLPVPAVVGTPIEGSIGFAALPNPL